MGLSGASLSIGEDAYFIAVKGAPHYPFDLIKHLVLSLFIIEHSIKFKVGEFVWLVLLLQLDRNSLLLVEYECIRDFWHELLTLSKFGLQLCDFLL